MILTKLFERKNKFSRKTPYLSVTNYVSMIDSVISKRQGDRRKHSFLDRKKYCIKGKMESLWAPRISHHLMDQAMKQSTYPFHKIFFHISKYLAINSGKILQLKITKKEWLSLTLWMKIQMYIPISYVTKMTQNKNDSINTCYWQ